MTLLEIRDRLIFIEGMRSEILRILQQLEKEQKESVPADGAK